MPGSSTKHVTKLRLRLVWAVPKCNSNNTVLYCTWCKADTTLAPGCFQPIRFELGWDGPIESLWWLERVLEGIRVLEDIVIIES